MAFRATRLATSLAAQRASVQTSTQVIGRRAASSSAPKKGGDTTWMIGSAAVFGSLGAFLLMPGSKTHEVAHGANHDRSEQTQHGADTPTARPGQDPVQHGGADTRSFTDDDPKAIHKDADKYPGTIPSKRHAAKTTGYPGETTDDSGSDLGSNRFSSDKPSGSSGSGSDSSETPDNVDESNAPSISGMKDSVTQAAKANVPQVAMDAVDKVTGSSSSGSGSDSSPSGSDTPSNVDDSNAPSAQDIKGSVRQAAKSNAPEVAWDEESKK